MRPRAFGGWSGRSVADVSLLLWDIGGVLLSNGWDRAGRAAAAARFGLDANDLERSHERLAAALETGRLDWAGYLAATVFDRPRPFSPADFRRFVWDRSVPHPEALAVARGLRARGDFTLAALNNESRELNDYRIERFHLGEIFHAFFSSCETGRRKPEPDAFRYPLALTHRRPEETLFLDDREENVAAAAQLGLRTVLVRDPERVREDLLAAGIPTE